MFVLKNNLLLLEVLEYVHFIKIVKKRNLNIYIIHVKS